MRRWFRDLDELLRGQKTQPDILAAGRLDLSLRRFVPLGILLGAVYGLFMGWYAVIGRDPAEYRQLLAAIVKLPALFFITLVVTFPSLYVFNALLGSQLRFVETLRLLIAAIVVNVAVAASLGPILGFFTFSTASYPFMIILNVALLGLSGAVGLGFLLHALRRMSQASLPIAPAEVLADMNMQAGGVVDGGSPLQSGLTVASRPGVSVYGEPAYGESRQIFRVWVIIYGLVGAQTGWLLRPFIGSPNMPFSWFRERQGNFFQSVWSNLQALIAG